MYKEKIKKELDLDLKVGELWVEGVSEIPQEVVNYFSNQFNKPFFDHPRFDRVDFHSLFREEMGV